jgi:hypothetical protein
MTRRVAIGNFSGSFLFRIAKAGLDALTASLEQLVIHEGMSPPTPWESGYVGIGAGGAATVGLSRSYSIPPFVIVRSDTNMVAGARTFYACFIASSNSIKIFNRSSVTMTVRYCVFAP